VTASSATITGSVNPNGAVTQFWFLYAANNLLSGATKTGVQSIGSGTNTSAISANISGLTGGTTYYYQLQASNSAGTVNGAVLNFDTTAVTPTKSTPSISSINPSNPTATVGNQNVTVNGSQFQNGLTVTVGFPGGGSAILSGSQIQGVNSSSFAMVINFNSNPGTYSIRVNNPDGGISAAFSFSVHSVTSTPVISSISPSRPSSNAGNQLITVFGSGFQSGLTVTVGFPNGGTATLSGTQIQDVGSSSFLMDINFNT
jgi:hypothetical protein